MPGTEFCNIMRLGIVKFVYNSMIIVISLKVYHQYSATIHSLRGRGGFPDGKKEYHRKAFARAEKEAASCRLVRHFVRGDGAGHNAKPDPARHHDDDDMR